MPDAEQLAIVTLVDARNTTLTQVWTSRDDYGFTYPLCATREAALGYAEAKWHEDFDKDEPNAVLTWTPGPLREDDNEGPTMHDIYWLEVDGYETGTFVFNMIVHPDAASAESECAIRADVAYTERDQDTASLDGGPMRDGEG